MKSALDLREISKRSRTQWRLATFGVAIVLMLSIVPIPYRETATGWSQPVQMHGVFALHAGRLVEQNTKNLQLVQQGQPVMCLSDSNAERELRRLESNEKRAHVQLVTHQRNRLYQSTRSIDLAPMESTVALASQQAAQAREEVERLVLSAPASGKLIMMPATTTKGPGLITPESDVKNWDDPTQIGRFINQGTMVAVVCNSSSVAVIPISDEQLEWIAEGTSLRLRCASDGTVVHNLSVTSIVPLRDATASMRLIENRPNAKAEESNISNAYAALVNLPEQVQAPLGGAVDAVFIAPSHTALSLFRRWLHKNLRWLAD